MAITLQWKDFTVPLEKLNSTLKIIVGSNYDGLICNSDEFTVNFLNEPTQEEIDAVNTFWNNATSQQFSPTLRDLISIAINNASAFGRTLILDAAVENVEMGITQAGKTREVANYCANIQRYLESGSLYAATQEMDSLIAAGVPSELSPYITIERLNDYKSRINTYLGI